MKFVDDDDDAAVKWCWRHSVFGMYVHPCMIIYYSLKKLLVRFLPNLQLWLGQLGTKMNQLDFEVTRLQQDHTWSYKHFRRHFLSHLRNAYTWFYETYRNYSLPCLHDIWHFQHHRFKGQGLFWKCLFLVEAYCQRASIIYTILCALESVDPLQYLKTVSIYIIICILFILLCHFIVLYTCAVFYQRLQWQTAHSPAETHA